MASHPSGKILIDRKRVHARPDVVPPMDQHVETHVETVRNHRSWLWWGFLVGSVVAVVASAFYCCLPKCRTCRSKTKLGGRDAVETRMSVVGCEHETAGLMDTAMHAATHDVDAVESGPDSDEELLELEKRIRGGM